MQNPRRFRHAHECNRESSSSETDKAMCKVSVPLDHCLQHTMIARLQGWFHQNTRMSKLTDNSPIQGSLVWSPWNPSGILLEFSHFVCQQDSTQVCCQSLSSCLLLQKGLKPLNCSFNICLVNIFHPTLLAKSIQSKNHSLS